MSQFVVYKNTNKNTSNAYPYFIDLQCDFLSGLNSQLVAPLTPETNFIQASQTKHSYSDAS
jgi:toxin CcdB